MGPSEFGRRAEVLGQVGAEGVDSSSYVQSRANFAILAPHARRKEIADDGCDAGLGMAHELALEAELAQAEVLSNVADVTPEFMGFAGIGPHQKFIADLAGDALPGDHYVLVEDRVRRQREKRRSLKLSAHRFQDVERPWPLHRKAGVIRRYVLQRDIEVGHAMKLGKPALRTGLTEHVFVFGEPECQPFDCDFAIFIHHRRVHDLADWLPADVFHRGEIQEIAGIRTRNEHFVEPAPVADDGGIAQSLDFFHQRVYS